jgi:hypothetical protein
MKKEFSKDIKYLLDDLRSSKLSYFRIRNMVSDKKNQKDLLELPMSTIFELIPYLYPQSYGFLIERRIREDMKFNKPKDDDSGDCSENNDKIEIKFSAITPNNDTINIRQIRMWQKCNYIILVVDLPQINDIYLFRLSHDEMADEIINCKATNSHGTKKSNQNNKNIENSISIKFDKCNGNFIRWCKKYRIPSPWDKELNINNL